jgi:AhpD family alkylhydroperoxidase
VGYPAPDRSRRPAGPVRPGFFGDPFLALAGEVLRGPSFWTAAERECLAVFSSQLNQCPFRVRMHTQVAGLESGGEIDVHHPQSAPPELLAVLPLLERVSRSPAQLTGADVAAVRAAGVPDAAIVDALHVNLIFNCINRLANAFGFAWDSDHQVRLGAKVIHRLSYRLPRILMR